MSQIKPRLGVGLAARRASGSSMSGFRISSNSSNVYPHPSASILPQILPLKQRARIIDLPQFKMRRKWSTEGVIDGIVAKRQPETSHHILLPQQHSGSDVDSKPQLPPKRLPIRAFRLELAKRLTSSVTEETQNDTSGNLGNNRVNITQRIPSIVTNPYFRRRYSEETATKQINSDNNKTRTTNDITYCDEFKHKRISLRMRSMLRKRSEQPILQTSIKCNRKPLETHLEEHTVQNLSSQSRSRFSLPFLNARRRRSNLMKFIQRCSPSNSTDTSMKEVTKSTGEKIICLIRNDRDEPLGIFVKKSINGFQVTRLAEERLGELQIGDEIVEIDGCSCQFRSLQWLLVYTSSVQQSISMRIRSAYVK